jgi:hypothetical protein
MTDTTETADEIRRLTAALEEMTRCRDQAQAEAFQYRTALQGAARRAASAVVPAADRAAALTEAADRYQGFIDNADTSADPRYWTGIRDMVIGLRHMAVESAAVDRVAAETPPAETPVHAVPVPGSNGISSCCGRPPCEFVGERVTRDPAAVTCPGPAVEAQPGKDTETPQPKEA